MEITPLGAMTVLRLKGQKGAVTVFPLNPLLILRKPHIS